MRETAKKRKNFFPAVALNLLFWLGWLAVIILIPPESLLAIFIFYLLLFAALLLTFSLLFANSRRGLLLSLFIIGFLVLKQLKLATILNLFLLSGLLTGLEVYSINLRKK